MLIDKEIVDKRGGRGEIGLMERDVVEVFHGRGVFCQNDVK